MDEEKTTKLTVIYEGKVNTKLDKSIEQALEPLGFRRWASGFNFLNGKRDLAFEKEEKPKGKRLELVTRVIDGDTRPRCGKKKHTPIKSKAQQGKFGSELARRRAGKTRRMRGITTEELESHLEESKGKNLPGTIKARKKQRNKRAG